MIAINPLVNRCKTQAPMTNANIATTPAPIATPVQNVITLPLLRRLLHHLRNDLKFHVSRN